MNKKKLEELALSLGTPAYVFDIDELKERVSQAAEKVCPAKICYAMKANPFLTEYMDAWAEHFEVCSPGEFHICVKVGIPMEKVVLSGVNKEYEDVCYAMEQGVATYTAESKGQFALVRRCAEELNKTVKVLLRVTSGNQFGMSEKDVTELIQSRESYGGVQITGLQYFSGTQKKSIKKIAGELEYIEDLLERLRIQEGFKAQVLEFGPGLGVAYFTKDDENEEKDLLEAFAALCKRPRPYALVLEMGRFLSASCGYYMTKVVDRKKNDAVNVCIVDGGIHHVNYYGQNMAMKTPVLSYFPQHPIEQEEEELWTVYGSLCTTADVLLKRLPLMDVRVGDYLAFHKIGAYSVTESPYLFLSRKMPKIYAYSAKEGACLLRDGLETWTLNTRKEEEE